MTDRPDKGPISWMAQNPVAANLLMVMLIVGGRNSANTARLAEICAEVTDRSHHVETADELDPAWFEGARRVGITGGASTPDWIIEDVVARLIQFEDATVVDRRNG